MSTRFEAASSERASRASFPGGTALTLGGYFYLHSLPSSGNYAPLFSLYGGFAGYWVGVNSAGRLVVFDYNGATFGSTTGSTVLSTGTWYYLWSRTASDFSQVALYLNASTTAQMTTSMNTGAPSSCTLQFASNEAGFDTDYHADVSLDSWKAWSVDRAASNAATEQASHALVSTTDALGEWWLDATDITDHHTSARNLTATGSLSVGPASPIDPLPAFDAYSQGVIGTGNISWTHTPVGTPRGILVLVSEDNNHGEMTGVTYGGVAMTHIESLQNDAGIDATVRAYFLGSGIPTGPQTVALQGTAGGVARLPVAISLTAAGDTAVVDSVTGGGANTAPSASLTLGGVSSFIATVLSHTNSTIAAAAGWAQRFSALVGTAMRGFIATRDAPTATNLNVNSAFTMTGGTDHALLGVAIQDLGGGGDVDLVVAGDTHGHTSDSPALTQAHQLAAAGDGHAHSSDSPALSQGYNLAAAGDSHAHTAESPALSQANTLAAPGDTHAHAADSPELQSGLSLLPADSAHAHTAESPMLSQAHILAVAGAFHAHTADSPTLSQALSLVVAESLHAHGSDSPELAAGYTLAVARVLHAHTAESPALTQAHILEVFGALHAHLADSPFLGERFPLDIAELEVAITRRLEMITALARRAEREMEL